MPQGPASCRGGPSAALRRLCGHAAPAPSRRLPALTGSSASSPRGPASASSAPAPRICTQAFRVEGVLPSAQPPPPPSLSSPEPADSRGPGLLASFGDPPCGRVCRIHDTAVDRSMSEHLLCSLPARPRQ